VRVHVCVRLALAAFLFITATTDAPVFSHLSPAWHHFWIVVCCRAYYVHYWGHAGLILALHHTLVDGCQSGQERLNREFVERMRHTTHSGGGTRPVSGSVVHVRSTSGQASSSQQYQRLLKFCADPLSPYSELRIIMAQVQREFYGGLARHILHAYTDLQCQRATYSTCSDGSDSSWGQAVAAHSQGLLKAARAIYELKVRTGRAQQQICARAVTAAMAPALVHTQLASAVVQVATTAAAAAPANGQDAAAQSSASAAATGSAVVAAAGLVSPSGTLLPVTSPVPSGQHVVGGNLGAARGRGRGAQQGAARGRGRGAQQGGARGRGGGAQQGGARGRGRGVGGGRGRGRSGTSAIDISNME
jgi:hypothetical protein